MKRGREEEELNFGPKNTCAYKIYALLYQERHNDAIKYAKRIKDPGRTMITLCDKNFEFSRPFMKEIGRYWSHTFIISDKLNDFRVADNLIKYFGVDFISRDVAIRSQLIERFIYFECTVDHYNALPPHLRDKIVAFLSALRQFRLPKDLRVRLVRLQVLQYFTRNTDVGHLIGDVGLKTESQTLAQQLRFAILTKNNKVICDFLQVPYEEGDLYLIVRKACNLRAVELYLLVKDRQLLSSFSLRLKEPMPDELFERFIARKDKVYVGRSNGLVWTDEQLRRLVYNEMIVNSDLDKQFIPCVQELHNKLRLGRELGITITLDKTYEVFKAFGNVGKHIYRMLCLRYWLEYTRPAPRVYCSSKELQLQWAIDNGIPISLSRPKSEMYIDLVDNIKYVYYFKQMWLFTE